MNEQIMSPPATPISVGDIVLQPDLWANEAQSLAAEYSGLPEALIFLKFARYFTALSKIVDK